jgi:hypothetical protein
MKGSKMTNDTEGLRPDPLNTPPFIPGDRVRPKTNPIRSFTVECCEKVVMHGRTVFVVYGPGEIRHFADDVELVPANSPESPDGSNGTKRPPFLIEGRTPFEFANGWYTADEIFRAINRSYEPVVVPSDVNSKEFATWLQYQYALAMNKGMEIARRASESELDNAQENHVARLKHFADLVTKATIGELKDPELKEQAWCIQRVGVLAELTDQYLTSLTNVIAAATTVTQVRTRMKEGRSLNVKDLADEFDTAINSLAVAVIDAKRKAKGAA